MLFTENALKTMNPEEIWKLFITTLHRGRKTGYISVPYKTLYPNPCWHQQNSEWSRLDEDYTQRIHPEYNSYVTLNTFTGERNEKGMFSRKSESCSHLNGIYIDFDFHSEELTCEEKQQYMEQFADWLKTAFRDGTIPEPTMIVFSGRGYALYYIYKESVVVANESERVELHTLLSNSIPNIIQALIPFDSSICDVDRTVKDFARTCRIPSTTNLSAGCQSELLYLNSDAVYSPEFLCEFFDIDNRPAKKAEKVRLPQVKKERKFEMPVYREGSKNPRDKRLANHRLKLIKAVVEDRCDDYIEATGRRYVIFAYYNHAVQSFPDDAKEMTQEINEMFREPLSDAEMNGIYEGVDRKQYYCIKTDTLVDGLRLTKEEATKYGFYENQIAQEERDQRKVLYAERDKEICRCYLAGMNTMDIAELLKDKYPKCSTAKTIRNRLNKYNLTEETRTTTKFEDIDFDGNVVYKRKKKDNGSEEKKISVEELEKEIMKHIL